MADEYCDEGVPFLRSLNIQPFRINTNDLKYIPQAFHERIRKSTLRPGDVGIVRTGYPGTACVIPAWLEEANCSDLVIVRPGPALNPHYLAAVFNSSFGRDLVGGNLVGAAQQHFNVTVAKELKLLLPPRKEQDKIAAILSAYDDLIANNQRRIALLEGMAEEIYREWFVRMRVPGCREERGEGLLPFGWARRPIGELSSIIKRGISPDYAEQGDGVVLNQKCIRDGKVSLAESRRHQTSVPAEKFVRTGDVLINSTGVGTLGRVAVFDMDVGGVTCDSHVTILRPDSKKIEPAYLGPTIAYLQGYFESMATGATGQAELSRELIARTKVLVPDERVQKLYAAKITPMLKQRRLLQDANVALANTRDALLPRLISGKLKVDHLDICLPPSMRAEAEAVA
ncbi:MAG: restriction endonuclease subunit S [Rubrivivax sp.]